MYAKSAIIKFTMVGNPEIKLLESRVRRKPQARFGEGYTEKGRLCYLAGYLLYTTDGRKIGLDQRLINPDLPDEPGSKVNTCIDNVFRIWTDTADIRGTQLVFCDYSTPKADGSFNVYDDIKQKLIAKGVPEEQIAFIHDATNEAKREELFSKVRSGEIRVLIGSTSKMGAGTNVQDRLVASHDLDAPYRPADMEQRRGRMVRQGNKNEKVHLYRYCTKDTFDAYLFVRHEVA